MTLRPLFGSLVLCTSLAAHALNTEQLPDATLLALGSSLAQNAGSSQWQQLWQRTRAAGHLTPGAAAHFTLAQATIVELVTATLGAADAVSASKGTRAHYRRDFSPLVTGMDNGRPLSAICLWVDWRTLPENAIAASARHLSQVSLLVSHPCP